MNRIISIDVFRGVTMFLMLWVNDFWTLNSIPKWLKHAVSGEDYLGFSDLIFPWFLFAIGLSIPFAFESRLLKGEDNVTIGKHILLRTIALLVMGLFHMNMEMYNHQLSYISKPIFVIISTLAFFMIWNDYSRLKGKNDFFYKLLPFLGIAVLIIMFFIYHGQDYDGNAVGFSIHWWGILGLIGWVYNITAWTYFVFKKSIFALSIAFFICMILNFMDSSDISYAIFSWQRADWIPGSGGLQALSFGGIITSLFLIRYKDDIRTLYGVLSFVGKYFIISKIAGTPPWILISMSTAIFLFIFLHWVVDVKKQLNWYSPISIAGTATLTCYLIPYFYYSVRTLTGFQLPMFLTIGIIGLFKSMLYSFLIIILARIASKTSIRLKI
jgi:heparan-alpha-glucosaminide N-acetyltransferase